MGRSSAVAEPRSRRGARGRFASCRSRNQRERIAPNEAAGYVEEGPFRHTVLASGEGGTIERIVNGECAADAPVFSLSDGRQGYAFHSWPVRVPRPDRRSSRASSRS